MRIIERIDSVMKSQGKTLSGLAEYLEMPKSTVYYWFKNSREIPCDCLAQTCEYLGVNANYLVTGDENFNPKKSEDDSRKKDRSQEDEEQLLQVFRSLDFEGRTLVLATAFKYRSKFAASGKNESAPSAV